ncbi:MAG: polysaccharide biosynthesis protein [Limosilactobacillus gorillae]|jgi:O-antigen/teichoic acid export membrane protein|uniref:putative polysaccharide biosynthesis protein n=1 Tax=Limosilactobacillus gorillae TaxID=1450649 RepID=UPI000AF06730|nr:polysaccharide biosynthesis protein [Limosilactobacillus gorillae]MDO4855692.1 polysaccharide biosynthesis protein [Limosilactobacillus gorillae]
MDSRNQPGTGSPASLDDSRSKMISGSAWMTAGSILSRILGAIYIIPWVTWMGTYSNQANALFAKGYNIYSLFLMVATAGIPSAISKMVAHYNGINQYGVSRRLYHSGMYVSIAMGLVCSILMFFGASLLDGGDPNVIPVIQSLAWAVLVIPGMSITRGFLQGYNWMAPSAMSQFVEQLLRVIYMLLATFVIMKLGSGDWIEAVTQSTFAAFIGALGSIVLLAYAFLRRKRQMDRLVLKGEVATNVSTKHLIGEIIYQSVPFIIIESGITLFQLIDQYTFFDIMKWFGNYSSYQLNTVYALFSFNANKLYMIIISLASAMAATAIPLLAEARAKNDVQDMRRQIENALLLFYFIMIPAALGLAAVAQQIYTVFYRYDAAGITVLQFAAFMSIPYGMYTVGAAMMQGISENRKMMRFLFVGIVIKFIVQVPAIWLFKGLGPLLATGVAMLFINYCILHSFNREFTLRFNQMAQPTNQILAFSLIMFVIVKVVMLLVDLVVSPYGRFTAFLTLVIGVAIGGAVFAYLALKYRLVDKLMGDRFASLRTRFHIK